MVNECDIDYNYHPHDSRGDKNPDQIMDETSVKVFNFERPGK